jgi:formyl-CoA transferase
MFGAEILKVERPGRGDVLRGVGPILERDGRRRSGGELRVMTNKRSLALDITASEGHRLLFDLVEHCDVVWTNQKPSTLKRLGITFETLQARNPQVVYATLSGFGHDDLLSAGPLADLRAFDVIAQGLGGLQFRGSGPEGVPSYNGLALGDEVTSTLTVLGIILALYRRQRDGGAQRVDVAMHDAMVFLNELSVGMMSVFGRKPPRGRSGTSAPYGAFRTRDGWVNIGVGGDPVWARFCDAIERPELLDDERTRSSQNRVHNVDWVDALVTAWTGTLSTADVVGRLTAFDVPCAPILDIEDVATSEQAAARQMLRTVDDTVAGPVRMVGNPVKMNGLDEEPLPAPPDVGQDTQAVLRDLLGLGEDELRRLRKDGVIGGEPPD